VYGGDTDFLTSSDSTSRSDPKITAKVTSASAKTKYQWYRSPVKVTFTCKPSTAPLVGGCPAAVTLSKNGGGQSVSRTINAHDGGVATVNVTGINIDKTRPTVKITGVKNGATYSGAAKPKPVCAAKDALSGLVSCKVKTTSSATVVKYVVTATDKAGNVTTKKGSFKYLPFFLPQAKFVNGAYDITVGKDWTVAVVSKTQPAYYDATPAPGRPYRKDAKLTKVGKDRWSTSVLMDANMTHHKLWNIGVKIGKKLLIVQVRVTG
jgi:hypothetical protein